MMGSFVHQLAQVGLQLSSSKTKIFTTQSLIRPFFVSLCGGVWRYGGSTHGRSDTQIFFLLPHGLFGRSARGPSAPASYGTARGAAAAQRAGRQLGTGGHASCRTSCRGGACAPGMGAWTGGDPSKVAASVFCTATLSRPHQRLYQPWVAAPRSGAGARMARERRPWWLRRVAGGHRVSAARPGSRRSTVLRRAAWHHMRRSRDAGDRPDRHLGQASERATVAERPGSRARLLRARPVSTRARVAWLAGREGRCGGRQHSDHRKHRPRRRSRVHGPHICLVRRDDACAAR